MSQRDLALVIDDSHTMCLAMSQEFAKAKADCLIAQSPPLAIDAFSGARPDAVFLDLVLEAACGVEAVPSVRAAWPGAPIVAMTGETTPDATDARLGRARRAGVDFLLPKPFRAPALLEVFADACAVRRGGPRPPRALVIDDSRTVRAYCARALEAAGWRVAQADTMDAALLGLDALILDVVITDIFMPGMGGIEGIMALRAARPELGVVAMSSGLDARMACDTALAAALKTGATVALPKPFKPETLVEAARSACQSRVKHGQGAHASARPITHP